MVDNTFIYDAGQYRLICEITESRPEEKDGVITVVGCKGHTSVITIPRTMEINGQEKPVKYIGKKAFLGKQSLRRIELPDTIEQVEDFAFAQCGKLATVVIRKNISNGMSVFGRKVFEDCTSLLDICVGTNEKNSLSALLAAIPVRLYDEHLMSDSNLGTRGWYEKWDNKLFSFILQDDEDGYTDLALCGEEDIKSDVPEYIRDKRMQKSALCLLRLKNDYMLSPDNRERFTLYLQQHTKGQPSDEAWKVILRDFGDDISYYKLFAQIGCIKPELIDDMIKDIGERFAEAKAYLIGIKQEHNKDDFFADFDL